MYLVRCQSASGRVHDAYIRATSEARAILTALRSLDASEGWRAVWALEQ
jgi:hypothetical protein